MSPPTGAIWSHFLKYTGLEDAQLKKMHNKSHYNAWCKYCIEAEISSAEDKTLFSLNQLSSFDREKLKHNAMRIVIPV